jgi:RNA polymerase sigma factor (sigma-70 family)
VGSEDTEYEADFLRGRDPDGSRFAAIYRAHVDAVLGYFAGQGVDAWTAADLTSETFAAALLHRRRYDPGKAPVRAWLLGIARNKLADSRRRWHRDRRLQQRLEIEPIALAAEDVESYERSMRDLVASTALTPPQAFAIDQRVIHERTYADVGREMGISEAAVRQLVSRGLRILRRKTQNSES